MQRKIRVHFIVISCLLVTFSDGKLGIRLRGLLCKAHDKRAVEVTVCRVQAVTQDIFETSIRIHLIQKPVNNVTAHCTLKKRNAKPGRLIYEFRIDACEFLHRQSLNPLAEMLFNVVGLKKYSNVNHTCPYYHDVIVEKLRFDESFVGAFPLPRGNFIFTAMFYTYNVQRVSFTASVLLYDK